MQCNSYFRKSTSFNFQEYNKFLIKICNLTISLFFNWFELNLTMLHGNNFYTFLHRTQYTHQSY